MVREFFISVYLVIFRIVFNLFKFMPLKEKTVFVSSFGDNTLFVSEKVAAFTEHKVIILKTNNCRTNFSQINTTSKVLNFDPLSFFDYIKSIYHLATSKVVFVDNYFGFLSVTDFKQGVQCIQLWHAAGAIKQFGLKDPSIKGRSDRAIRRFTEVYSRFTSVVVGSEKMVKIFEESFGIPSHRMLRTGVPRTDIFFDDKKKREIIRTLKEQFSFIQDKKVILYAPTFRDNELHSNEITFDIIKMYQELSEEYILLLRLHPSVKARIENIAEDFVFDVSDYDDINHLLLVTDILISDYSSIPFEFSLLERPMIFYAYDLEDYEKTRGFWEDYEGNIPGPITKSTEDVLEVIKRNTFYLTKVNEFAQTWNEYSNGHSSEQLVQTIYKTDIHSKKMEMAEVY